MTVPHGFIEAATPVPGVGVLFARTRGGETALGFAVTQAHCAASGALLPALQAAFAAQVREDFVRDLAAPQPPPVLVSLTSAFIAQASEGQWVEGAARLIRRTRSLVFAAVEVRAGGRTMMTAEGVWQSVPDAAAAIMEDGRG